MGAHTDELVDEANETSKHVIVGKPFTQELAAAQRLTEMVEARGLKLAMTHQLRYLAGQRTVRRLMTEWTYGEVQSGYMITCKARGREHLDGEHSQLWRMAVHEIDSLMSMMN